MDDNISCPLCSNKLKEPYIQCDECNLELCLKVCFYFKNLFFNI